VLNQVFLWFCNNLELFNSVIAKANWSVGGLGRGGGEEEEEIKDRV